MFCESLERTAPAGDSEDGQIGYLPGDDLRVEDADRAGGNAKEVVLDGQCLNGESEEVLADEYAEMKDDVKPYQDIGEEVVVNAEGLSKVSMKEAQGEEVLADEHIASGDDHNEADEYTKKDTGVDNNEIAPHEAEFDLSIYGDTQQRDDEIAAANSSLSASASLHSNVGDEEEENNEGEEGNNEGEEEEENEEKEKTVESRTF